MLIEGINLFIEPASHQNEGRTPIRNFKGIGIGAAATWLMKTTAKVARTEMRGVNMAADMNGYALQ